MQLTTALEGFWLSKARTLSQNTVNDYNHTYGRFIRFLAAQHVEDLETVTPQHIEAFLAWLASDCGLAPKTILNHWIALSALWTWGEKTLELPHIIRGRVAPPRVRRQQPEPYTHENVKRMIEACDQTDHWRTKPGVRTRRSTAKRDKAILFTLLDTGLRASELCDLRIEDYDKSIGKLIVRKGKGGKGRSVFLGYTARSALWRYLEDRQRRRKQDTGDSKLDKTDGLFTTSTGRHLTRDNLLHMIQAVGRRADVSGATVHRWRHTFAINMLRNGCNPYALQELLGHSDMETVRLYLKIVDQDLRGAVASASPADQWRL